MHYIDNTVYTLNIDIQKAAVFWFEIDYKMGKYKMEIRKCMKSTES